MPKKQFQSYLYFFLLAVVVGVASYVRIRLLSAPLERDEGEFAYMGQLVLKGIAPFSNAYSMKIPGAGVMYAIFMLLFGQTPAGIHLGLLLVNGLSIYLVFILARRFFERDASLAAAACFAQLSLSQSVFGVFAHATHLVVLFALPAFILLLHLLDRGRILLLFASGFCFGLSFIMKQHAFLLIMFALLYLLWRSIRSPAVSRNSAIAGCALFLLGVIIPYALVSAWMAQAGTFGQFWFWTVKYAREYASGPTLAQGLTDFIYQTLSVSALQWPFWLISIAGGILLLRRYGRGTDRFFIFGFFIFSFLAICPGFYFREHYYILLLPAVALLTGAAVQSAGTPPSSAREEKFRPFIPFILLAAAVTYGLCAERAYFFTLTPEEVSRALYGTNPFPEALQVGRYLKDHTSGTDRIAVLGSEPEIYFYADRLSASGYIYMYGMMENQPHAERMQQEMIREIEHAGPKYVVTVNVAMSWLTQPFSRRMIIDWGKKYVATGYEPVGIIEIADSGVSTYRWDGQAAGYTPVAGSSITVYKRKEGV